MHENLPTVLPPAGSPARARTVDAFQKPTDELFDLRRFLARLWNQKAQIILCAILAVAGAAVLTYFETPLYRSTALVQVNPKTVQPLPYTDPFEIMGGSSNYETYLRTQEEILKSPGLAIRVAETLHTKSDADVDKELPHLMDRLEVVRVEGSQLFRIGYLAESPEAAATIVNVFADELIREQIRTRHDARDRAREALKRELAALEDRLQASETELVSYASRNSLTSLAPGDGEPTHTRLTAIETRLADAEAERVAAKSNLDSLKSVVSKSFPERFSNALIRDLSARLLTLENELAQLRVTFGDNWPEVKASQAEIELVRKQLQDEKAAAVRRALDDAETEFLIADSRYQMIQEMLSKQRGAVNNYQRASIQYNILRREVDTNEKMYEGLLERLKESSLLAGFEAANIQIVESGSPQELPETPNVPINLGLASLLGLAVGVCITVIGDYWSRSITSIEEVEGTLGLPALGAIPTAKRKGYARLFGGPNLVRISAPGNGDAQQEAAPEGGSEPGDSNPSWGDDSSAELREEVIAICTSILLSQADSPLRVIAVTSALPGEGKTTVTGLLGRAMAENGYKTLIVDADLRRSTLSTNLGVHPSGGLSMLLSGNVEEPAVRGTFAENLYVLSSGPKPPNSVALLSSEKMRSFLRQARSEYQCVILDTPPVLSVADARVLAPAADGVLLVARAGKTKQELISRAWSQVVGSGARGLGVVLNGHERTYNDLYHYDYHTNK